MANPNTGKFTWHELMLKDEEKPVKFYTELFGWTVDSMDMGPAGTYRMFKKGDKTVAGSMKLPMADVPSHWLTYVAVEDTDATAAKITEQGGKIVVPPTSVPDMVRFLVAMDKEGAVFGVVQDIGSRPAEPLASPPPVGHFCWDELYVKDPAAAAKFYGAIFGWTGKVGENDPMKYWHWLNQGKDIGGMMTLPSPEVPPNWLAYVNAGDVDASLKRAQSLGAKVMMGPMDIEKVGKFAILSDPGGAVFAIYQSANH
jgi:predicted enzyme related to lactoylglutathione lyase